MNDKQKFALYLSNVLKEELKLRFREDGSRSQTEFVANALKFYLDFLSINKGSTYLPTAIKSCIDGRIGTFEDRISSLLFKLSVENDMMTSLLIDQLDMDEEYLRKLRINSISNVKKTNGRLSIEQKFDERCDE
ncbi:MAG: hypothetical protein R3Y09_11240 [Clostridia bacterium]